MQLGKIRKCEGVTNSSKLKNLAGKFPRFQGVRQASCGFWLFLCAHSTYVLCSCVCHICFTSVVSVPSSYLKFLYSSHSSYYPRGFLFIMTPPLSHSFFAFKCSISWYPRSSLNSFCAYTTSDMWYPAFFVSLCPFLSRLVAIWLLWESQPIYISYLFQRRNWIKSHHSNPEALISILGF